MNLQVGAENKVVSLRFRVQVLWVLATGYWKGCCKGYMVLSRAFWLSGDGFKACYIDGSIRVMLRDLFGVWLGLGKFTARGFDMGSVHLCTRVFMIGARIFVIEHFTFA